LFVDDIKNELYNNPIWCKNGTFGVSPSGFCQVGTIGIIRSHHVIPIVYGILKNKREEAYVYFLKNFKLLIPNLEPGYIIADFEKAALNAFKKAFPRAILQSCLFHLGQNH
jgi:hypothetical protein